MNKRQGKRERQRLMQKRQRAGIIALIAIVGMVIALIFVASSLNSTGGNTAAQITPITPATWTAPVKMASIGNPEAPVKMDVWEDFQCPGCRVYSQDIEPQIFQNYVETGKVYYTFHFYPFIDRGQGESHDSANAALCAADQERFWDYHTILFANWQGENVGSFAPERLSAFAENLGLDMAAFNECFKGKKYADYIQQDIQAGAKLGVPPTPGIFINGQIVISSAGKDYIASYDDIAKAIEAALGNP